MHWTFRDDKTRVPQALMSTLVLYTSSPNQAYQTKQCIGRKQYWQMRKLARGTSKPSKLACLYLVVKGLERRTLTS